MKKQRVIKNEKGSVFVEATLVFPTMFLVIFMMIFAGNAYYQKCRVEQIVNEMTIEGAALCADPLLYYIESGTTPDVKNYNANPYSAILTSDMNTYEEYVELQIKDKINAMGTGLFTGMKPKIVTGPVATYDNSGLIYATFTVELGCDVVIPVKLLGQEDFTIFKLSNRTEMPVTDTVEFIRNMDMVQDFMESTGLTQKIEDAIAGIKDMLSGTSN